MLFDLLPFLTLEFYAVYFCYFFCFVLVGFICFFVLSGLGDLYLVLVLKFCFVLSLTRIKPKDIAYTSGINEDDIIDLKGQCCAFSLSTGWLPGHGKPGAGRDLLAGCGLSEGSSPKGVGMVWAELGAGDRASNCLRHGKR